MTNWRPIRASLLAAAFAAALPTASAAQALQRAMFVSALDKSGAPVEALAPADLVVREDNVAREILRIAPADEPMQVAFLVDNSQAGEPYVREYREASARFITALTENKGPGTRNEVALIMLAERPTIAVDYTFDQARLLKGAERIFAQPGSGTYLLDAIIEVSRGLDRRRATRPVIVAITTEGLELSDRSYQQVLEPLRASGAAFHVVVVGAPRNLEHDRSVVLAEGPRQSGGQYENLLAATALPDRIAQLAREITHQFKVTYARPQQARSDGQGYPRPPGEGSPRAAGTAVTRVRG
jgi:hypothetical protein